MSESVALIWVESCCPPVFILCPVWSMATGAGRTKQYLPPAIQSFHKSRRYPSLPGSKDLARLFSQAGHVTISGGVNINPSLEST